MKEKSHCDYSNESPSAVLLFGTLCFNNIFQKEIGSLSCFELTVPAVKENIINFIHVKKIENNLINKNIFLSLF